MNFWKDLYRRPLRPELRTEVVTPVKMPDGWSPPSGSLDLGPSNKEAFQALLNSERELIEKVFKEALQDGRFGVLVVHKRMPWRYDEPNKTYMGAMITAKIDADVPYGEIHVKQED